MRAPVSSVELKFRWTGFTTKTYYLSYAKFAGLEHLQVVFLEYAQTMYHIFIEVAKMTDRMPSEKVLHREVSNHIHHNNTAT